MVAILSQLNRDFFSYTIPKMSTNNKKYNHIDIEKKWACFWEENNTYKWDPEGSRETTFSIDTPPPTVSGSLHIGHVFSYTQTDIIARYQRMRQKNVFYPMGWDDNGLPTERRVQNVFGIHCDPSIPYKPEWTPTPAPKSLKASNFEPVSRRNFIEACHQLTQEDEQAFEAMWKKLGLSVDWSQQYATINTDCQRMAQLSFLRLMKKGIVYHTETPSMWDTDFQTAVAQAELEDREVPGHYYTLEFNTEDTTPFTVATTRPELLPACIAIVAHPDDARYQPLFGKNAISPLFGAKVPILPATHADPEKGTGILMVCTFGDIHDVEWWKQSQLPIKQIIGRKGRLLDVHWGTAPFESVQPEIAQKHYDSLKGLSIKKAHQHIVTLLRECGALIGEPEPMTHAVKFYEKGDSPIEFIPTRQWFVSVLNHKADLIQKGQNIQWYPPYMKTRYEHWVNGLNQDWCISRQRYFGVPFPVWYPLDAHGEPDYTKPLHPSEAQLPCDPQMTCPDGYEETQRHRPNGFIADPDVMDTWATSSLTPQIMSGWEKDPQRHSTIFPYDIRPQAHELIRTWAFYTIVQAHFHNDTIPWKTMTISGWVLDPERKKMSKSKGNVVTPTHLIDTFSADAIRYWSAKAKLGTDTAFEENMFLIGKKLITKLFNASKFVMLQIEDAGTLHKEEITSPIDCAHIESLRGVITAVTEDFNAMEYSLALEKTERAFWQFYDY